MINLTGEDLSNASKEWSDCRSLGWKEDLLKKNAPRRNRSYLAQVEEKKPLLFFKPGSFENRKDANLH